MITFDEEQQKETLEELHQREEEALAEKLSEKYEVPYVDLTGLPINTDALVLIPEEEAREHEAAAFDVVGKKVRVAFRSPGTDKAARIKEKLEEEGYQVESYIVSRKSLQKAWSRYKEVSGATQSSAGLLDISSEEISAFLEEASSKSEVARLIRETLSMKGSHRITRVVEIIVAGALSLKASDIHIEPAEEEVHLRMRLDGILVPLLTIDHGTYELLLSRIKLLSGLKLNIQKDAQDGRFSIKLEGREIEVRTSVLPGANGESIVLRVLDPATLGIPLADLGMAPHLLEIVEKELKKPNGMILNTGPTGSGKTTTLYAFLDRIYKPELKVITIEDPIEYHLGGIVQTQVDASKNYTFEQGLKSSLRQDPDVMMVGEIRDDETAATAIHAALTGHLVFSTLHTNTAAGTFPRLFDLNVNPDIIGSAINITIAQRLVRKLCTNCRKKVDADAYAQALIKKVLQNAPHKEEWGEHTPVEYIWQAEGCEKCGETGYRGRIGIFEAIIVGEAIDKVIKQRASEEEIAREARDQNIFTMQEDGVVKMIKGITDLAELERVIDLNI